jgi:hypothetical protein
VGHQESVWFCATSLWQTYLKTKLQQITFMPYSIELMWHMRRSCGMALIFNYDSASSSKSNSIQVILILLSCMDRRIILFCTHLVTEAR